MAKDNEQKRFDAINAAIDDAILAATPAEIVEELRLLGIDPAAAATAMRARIRAAIRSKGKKAMEEARKRADNDSSLRIVQGGAPNSAELRAKLARLLSRPGIPTTLAARDGKSMSDADIESLIADLAELGITDDEK